MWISRRLWANQAAAVTLACCLVACGSDKVVDPPVTCPAGTTGTPPNCTALCTQSVVESGSGTASARTLYFDQFSVPDTGRLDITVDWTFASSAIGVYLVPANTCNTVEEFNNGSCNFLLRSNASTTPKPKKLSIPNLAAGNYKWFIGNGGTQEESLSYQFVLSKGSGCPAFGSTPVSAQAQEDSESFESMRRR